MRIAILVVMALFLAGCSDGHDSTEPFTCPDGQTVDVESIPGHHAEGFNPEPYCPVAPYVTLEAPLHVQAYFPAELTWRLHLGTADHAHAMLTSVRMSTEPVADAALGGPSTYPDEVAKREHQDLPQRFNATLRHADVGNVYLRAYAEIDGEDVWSEEVRINITEVTPTGTEHVLIHSAGAVAGEFTPATVDAALGDAVVLQNDDVIEHVFSFSGSTAYGTVTVPAQSSSEALVLDRPGAVRVESDDLVPKVIEVNVSSP